MRLSPPVSESEFDWESVVSTTDDEFMVQAVYRNLENNRQELQKALESSQNTQAGLEVEVTRLKASQYVAEAMLEEASAEKTRLANELKTAREEAERNQRLVREEKSRNEAAAKTARKEHEAALKKSNNEIDSVRAELNRLKVAPQSQTLGGRTVDELAEGLLRAFAGPKSNFIAGKSAASGIKRIN